MQMSNFFHAVDFERLHCNISKHRYLILLQIKKKQSLSTYKLFYISKSKSGCCNGLKNLVLLFTSEDVIKSNHNNKKDINIKLI